MKDSKYSRTYCNPLPIPDCPRGTDGWQMMAETGEKPVDYRSISDPSVYYMDGKWYMYPSYGMAFVSEDFAQWKHIPTEPYNMKYSPCIIPYGEQYLMTSHSNGLYIGDSPLGPFRYLGDFMTPSGEHFTPTDPALFVDDDGRIYLYCFGMRGSAHRRAFITGTYGAELNRENPRELLTELKVLFEFNPAHEWERFGEKRQDILCGWLEGQWMLKKNGRYYLIYAAAGTEYSNYCMAAYVSDESPLSGFVIQKNSPFLESKSRLISGAGHGCVTEGPNGTLWAFYTISVARVHIYERLVGMDLIAINDEGELYAPHGVTDTPQLAPGVAEKPEVCNDAGLLPLTARQRGHVFATSREQGRDAFYALDESMLTFWQPCREDNTPILTVNLAAPYLVCAVRIIWTDIGLDYENGVLPEPFRFVVEGRPIMEQEEWVTLVDKSTNEEDRKIDYLTFEPVSCESVRLKILGHLHHTDPAVTDFTAFGIRDERQ